jgi:hypothetical protein
MFAGTDLLDKQREVAAVSRERQASLEKNHGALIFSIA